MTTQHHSQAIQIEQTFCGVQGQFFKSAPGRRRHLLIIVLLLCFLPFGLFSQGVDITGNASINQCETNSYTIELQNNSGNTLTNLVIVARLENLTGFSYVTGTSYVNFNGGGNVVLGNPTISGAYSGLCAAPVAPYLSWNVDALRGATTLLNGQRISITFDLQTNCDAVSGSLNTLIDYQIAGTPMCDNTGVLNIQVNPGAVTIKKTPNVIPQELGQNVTWTLTIENTGFGVIKNVKVTDELGAGLTYVSCTQGGVNAGQTTTWDSSVYATLSEMDPGDIVTMDITAQVVQCQFLDNVANVRFGCDAVTDCFNTADDGGTATASVQRIVKTPLIDYTPPNITFNYCEDYVDVSFTISNIGDGRAHSVWTVVDFSPLTVSNVSAGTIYNTTDHRFEHADPIAPGGSYELSFRLNYASWCGGTFPAKDLLWQKVYEDDCHQLFYPPVEMSVINPPVGAVSLALTKGGAGSVIQIGDVITYTITSSYTGPLNCGSGSTGLMTVVDTIPTGFVVIDADGGSYVPGGGGTGGTITWSYLPPATLSKTITVQSPLIANCETYCNTTFANSVSATGTDCCGCVISASASETSAIECAEGVTSQKIASSPIERCDDVTYTNTYNFDPASGVTLNNLVFTEHADSEQLYNNNLSITLNGAPITGQAVITDTTSGVGGTVVLDFSGAPATSLAGAELIIQYNLTATEDTVAACTTGTFYSWSSLSMGASGSSCLGDGVIHETTPVTVGVPEMSLSITGLGAIFHKCQTQTITLTLTQTSIANPKDVKLTLSGLNYYVIDPTNPAAITCSGDVSPVACLPTVDGNGDYNWTFNDLFTGQNQQAVIQLTVEKRCTGTGDLVSTAYFDDRCTDDAVSDELCSVTATETPTLLLNGDLLIEKTPEVYYATINTVQWVIYLTNRGTGTAYNVWVDDVLGAGLIFNSAVVDDMTGVTVTGNLNHAGTVINGANIAITDMTAGERRMITFTAEVIDCDNLTNLATTSWGCIGVDCQVAVTDTSTVKIPAPNLINTNTITPAGGVNACSSPDGFITLRNAGQVTCYNLQVTETLPAGLLYVSGTTRWRLNGGGWNGPHVTYDPVPTTSPLVWTKTQIPGLATSNPGDTIEIEFQMISDCPFLGGDLKVATQYENPCADVFTNAESKFTVAFNEPDIVVTKTRANDPIDCNQAITWNITVTNNSGYVMPVIWVEDTMDAAYTYVSSTGHAPYTSDTGTNVGQKVTWELESVPTATTVTLTLTAQTDSSPCSPDLDNTVQAWWGCGNPDGDSGTKPGVDETTNNICLGATGVSAVRTETRQPTVGYVAIALSPSTIDSCDDDTQMTLEIANTGITDARQLDLVVTLPTGLTYNANSSLLYQGIDNSGVAVPTGEPTIVGNVLTYYNVSSKLTNLTDTLEADGGSDTLVLKFSVKSSCYVTQNVGLSLRYYDCCDDTQYTTSTTQQVTALFPTITVDKTPNTTSVDCGDDVTWTVVVSNTGTGNAQVVRVEDTLGAWLDYAGNFTEDQPGTITPVSVGGNPQVIGWEFNNLAAGTSATFTFDSTLNPDGLPNQADCTTLALRQNSVRAIWGCGTAGDATDDNPNSTSYDCTNTAWSATDTTIVQMPDLHITAITPGITCTTAGVDGAFTGSVTVTVHNQGTAATLTGFTVSVTDGTWTGTGTTGVLAAGASVTVTIDTAGWAIDCHACTPYTLDATVDSTLAVCECNEANNTSSLSYTPQLPDLQVNSITPTCTADGRLRVRVNVSNVGCANSTATFVVSLVDDQGHSATQNVTSLNAGANVNVDFTNWVSACSPATVNFTAVVDSTNTNCECSSSNTLLYAYNNPLPNLEVTTITPSTSCTGDGTVSGTIAVQISNTGNGPVTADFRLSVTDGQGWTATPWYSATLGGTLPLAAGANATVNVPWTRGFTTAPYTCNFPTITVTLDTTSVICECSNASNASTSSYSMIYPNLRITSVTPTCTSDGTYSVAVVVNNNGCGTATNAVVRVSDNDGQTSDQTVTLAAGASSTLTFAPWPADGNPATLTFTTTLDPGTAICELTGTDNTNSTNFTRGNLNLVSITPACTADGTYQVSLVIQNNGSAAINSNFVVRLTDNDGHTSDQNFTAIGGTLPFNNGTSQTVVFSGWTVDCNPTTINFSGALDPTDLACESNSGDNTNTGTITINDLRAVSVVPATSCASDGSITGTMVVTVANDGGNAINSDFSISVSDGQGWTSQLRYNADLGGTLPIAVGTSQSVTFNWTRSFSGTPYVCSFPGISVTVDSLGAICECTSSNNTNSATYSMTYPNLNVVSVTPTCTSDGTYSIAVVVSNNGCGTATNAVVRLSDNDGQTADQTVTLAAGASATLTYSSWPADGNPAALTFTATIDPAAALCELTGDDHSEVVTYNNPNLRIVSITPECATDGSYSVSMVIENNGAGAVSSDFVVRLADNDGHTVNANFTAIGGTLPLAVGTQQTVVFTPWTVDGNPTTINFSGTLDPTNLICESNNSDNGGSGTFTVNDLNAVSVVAATSCASDGSITGTMVVTVSNLGGNAINSDFSILVDDGQGWTSELRYNADLGGTLPIAPGATSSVTFTWGRSFSATPYVCSFPAISASIDSQAGICEVTSANNGASTTYSMTYPNLYVVSVTPTCSSDGSYSVAVVVGNNGCGTATGAVVRLSDNDGQSSDQTVTLAAGASTTLTYSPWAADGNPAALIFTATIDPAAAICELTGDDHTEIVTYNTPNLDIVSITPSCTTDGTYQVSIIIANTGTGAINSDFVVRLADNDGHTVNANFTAIGGTLPLAAGTQQTVVFTPWTVDGNPTTINFTGTLDPTNLICESNNSDNGGSGTITVYDLNSVSVVAATSCASDGSITGTMVVTLTNTGGNAINNDFSILVDDGRGWTSELLYNANLGGTLPIAPGASVSVTFNWTRDFSAIPYVCSFPAIAVTIDSQGDLCEVTSGNNTDTTTYTLPYPNLRAISVTPTCSSDGTYSIAVVVDNNGCGNATNAVVRLSDNDGHSVDQTVTLAPGVPQTLTFSSWPVDGNPAALIFTAEIDPDDAICELTDPDTVGLTPNHTVIITYNNPNLHLVSITPTCTADTTYRVDMIIENNGTADISSDFVVRLADNDGHTLDRNFTAIGGVLPLTAGTQQTVTFNNWTVDCNPTTINFSGTLDPTDQICESNSTDDTGSGTITINNLDAVSVVAATSCASDGTITGTMVVTLTNVGGNPINTDFRILVDDGQGWTSELWYQAQLGGTLPIAVGASPSVTIPWTRGFTTTPYTCSFPAITVTVDSQGDICECNSVDNQATTTYTLPYPDLTITTVGSSVTCLGDGSLTGTTVTVRNGGCAGVTGVVIRLTSDCGLTFSDQTVNLAAGESQDVFFAFTSGIVSCTCNFNAVIDPDSLICELDGTNNTGSSVATMLIPDLEVQSEATLIACTSDGVFRVSGTVTLVNNGCGPNFVGNVPMRFTLFNRTGCTGTQIAQWVQNFNGADMVSAGGTQVFTITDHDINGNFFNLSTNCMVSLRIEADYNNTICEWDGTDNTLCVDKTSDCLDLEALEIKATTACVADGNFTRALAFTLRNSGGKPITHDFSIKVDDGNGWSSEKRYNVDLGGPLPLAAGVSATVTFNWNRTIDTTTCDFGTITAQVDTQNEICQGSTDNDMATSSYEMPYANLKPTAIAVSCSTDGFYTAKVTITNDGCADCGPGNFTIRMQDNLGNTFDQVISTSTMTKGASYTVEFSQWPAACDPDEITFTCFVDTKNTVCEVRGDDNQMSFVYKNLSPDLVISSLTPSATCSTPGNISGAMTITLLNQGNGPVTQDFRVTCDDGAGWTTEKYYAGDLGGSLPIAANETVTIRIPWNRDFTKAPFTCNFNNIKVGLDVNTGICECKAENNETTATYSLPFTDLKLEALALLCQQDGQKQIQFTVGNDGCEDQRDDFTITISELVSGQSKPLSFTALGGKLPLRRGTTQTIIYSQWNFDCTATSTQFKCSLGAGSFCDLRAENNTVTVAQSTTEPDLLLENVEWTCNTDGTITFRVSVANIGSGNAASAPITVYDNRGQAIFTRTIDLTPGAHAQFAFTTAPYPTNTSLTFRFVMDESDIICECNGANNEKTITVNCSGGSTKPVLEISKICPPGQQPGGLFRFEIHLTNTGQSDLSQLVVEDFLPVGFQYVAGSSVWNGSQFADPQGSDPLTWTIPTLAKNSSGTLIFSAVANADIDPGRYCNTAQANARMGDLTAVEVRTQLTECCVVVTRENGMGCCLDVEEYISSPFYKPDSPLSLIEPYFRTDSSMFAVYSIYKLWQDQNLEADSMPRFMKERLINYARSNIEEFYLTSRLGLTLNDNSLWLSVAGAYPEQNKKNNAGNAWVHHQVDETMTLSQMAFELLALNEAVSREDNPEVKEKLHTIIQKKLTFLAQYKNNLPHAWELKAVGQKENGTAENQNSPFAVRDLDGDATLYDRAAFYLAATELQRNGYVDWAVYDQWLRPLLKSLDNTSFDRNNRREEFLFILALQQSGQPELQAQAKAKMLNFEEIFAKEEPQPQLTQKQNNPPKEVAKPLDNIADYSLAIYLDRRLGGTLFPDLMKRMKAKFYLADTGIYADQQPDFTYKLQLRDLAPLILAFDTTSKEEQEHYATVLYRTFDEVGLFLKKRNLMEGNPLYSLLRNYPFAEPLLPVLSFTKAKRNIAPVFSRDAVVHSTLVKPLGEILIPGAYTKILSPVYETAASHVAAISFGLQYLGSRLAADFERVNKEEGRSLTERGKTYMDSLLVSGAGYLENNTVLVPFDHIAIKGPKPADFNLEPLNAGITFSSETLANYLLAETYYVTNNGKQAEAVRQLLEVQYRIVAQLAAGEYIPLRFQLYIEPTSKHITIVPSAEPATKMTVAKLLHLITDEKVAKQLGAALKKAKGQTVAQDLLFLSTAPQLVPYFQEELTTFIDPKDASVTGNTADVLARLLLGQEAPKVQKSLDRLAKQWDKVAIIPQSDDIETIEKGVISHHTPGQFLLYLLAMNANGNVNVSPVDETKGEATPEFRFKRTLNLFTYLLENEWGVQWDNANSFITLPSADYQVFKEEPRENAQPGDRINFRVRVDNTCPDGIASGRDLSSLYLKATFTPSLLYIGTQPVEGLDVIGDFQWHYNGFPRGSLLEYWYQAHVPNEFAFNYIDGTIYAGGRQGLDEQSNATTDCEDLHRVRRFNIVPYEELQGLVYEDRNVNGIKDVGEPGIPNILFKDTRGRMFRSDAEGRFTVFAGDEHEGVQMELKSVPAHFLLKDNPTKLVNRHYTGMIYFSLIPCKTLTGFVYQDENENGYYDTGEIRPAGVVLKAKDKEVVTGAEGKFLFRNLPVLWQEWVEIKKDQPFYKTGKSLKIQY